MKTKPITKTITTLLLVLLFFSCNDDKDCCGMYIATFADISYADSEGNDLLNPDNDNGYKEENIDIYRLSAEGEKIKMYDHYLAYPENFKIFYSTISEQYILRLFLSPEAGSDDPFVTYFINFGNGEEDKVEGEIERLPGVERLIKIWYNDILVWELEDNDLNYFEIVK